MALLGPVDDVFRSGGGGGGGQSRIKCAAMNLAHSQISRYRLPTLTDSPHDVPLPMDKSVAMRKNVSPSLLRMMNGSLSPLVPLVEVNAGCPALRSVHDKALLPLLAAK